MKHITPFIIVEAIIDWKDQGLEEFLEDAHDAEFPMSVETLMEIGASHEIEIVDYDTFYDELPDDQYRAEAPPRGVPAFASVNPVTRRPRVIVSAPRVDRRLFDYIYHMLKHEMIHVGQWSRREADRTGPSPLDRTAYFSDKDEIMAFSHSIADMIISSGARTVSDAVERLGGVRLYQDIKKAVDPEILKRYHKYIYLYLEMELDNK